MGGCSIIFIVIFVVVLLVFGTILVAFINVIYRFLLDAINSIKRSFWSKNLAGLPYAESKKMLGELEISLESLKRDASRLTTELGVKGREMEDFFQMLKIDGIEAKIDDAKAKIDILSNRG